MFYREKKFLYVVGPLYALMRMSEFQCTNDARQRGLFNLVFMNTIRREQRTIHVYYIQS